MPDKPSRRRGKAISPAEHTAIQTMIDAGKPVSAIATALNRSRNAVTRAIQEAKDLLGTNAKYYAQQHLKATGIAAAKGDARPAEWALERLKVVEPVKTQADTGFTVQIGIALPGLGLVTDLGKTGVVLDAETVTARDARLANAQAAPDDQVDAELSAADDQVAGP